MDHGTIGGPWGGPWAHEATVGWPWGDHGAMGGPWSNHGTLGPWGDHWGTMGPWGVFPHGLIALDNLLDAHVSWRFISSKCKALHKSHICCQVYCETRVSFLHKDRVHEPFITDCLSKTQLTSGYVQEFPDFLIFVPLSRVHIPAAGLNVGSDPGPQAGSDHEIKKI